MPSGKIHDKIAIFSYIPIALMGVFLLKLSLIQAFILAASAYVSQTMFGPDLDLKSLQYKRWGVFRFIWWPYMITFKHRGKYSHGIIHGPLIRIIYLSSVIIWIAMFIDFVIYKNIGISMIANLMPFLKEIVRDSTFKLSLKIFYVMFLGLFIGGFIHTLTDKLESFFKNFI